MIGKNIIRLEETDSTNRYAAALLKYPESIEEGTLVITNHQAAGRGTGENTWESEKGKNLTLSIVLHPSFLPLEKQFMMNKMVSLSILDMIGKISCEKDSVKIKWPNDIYVGNKKISGTLIENAIIGNKFQYFILGIGININQEVFVSDAPNPVSLKNITGKVQDLEVCLAILCSCMDKRYTQLKGQDENLLNTDYLSALYRMGVMAAFIYHEQIITAKITGITPQGKLLLEKTDGTVLDCDFKEVEFII